jgi:hypothetical protein
VSEAINKLQPDRALYLRGFDNFGAAAALYAASPTGFKVSGVFRDAADFAVLVLHDADCFYEHPRLKYLPDFNLAGLVLSFNLQYTNLQPIDSPKYPTIDWPYLDVARPDGSTAQIPLFAHATQAGGAYTHATGAFTIAVASGTAVIYDRITLWYQNVAFDFLAGGGETPAAIAANLAWQINSASWGTFSTSLAATSAGATITITANPAGCDGNMVTMYSVSKNANLSTAAVVHFTGGSSAATWAVSIDFSALGIDQARQAWLTFAPPLANGAAFTAQNWDAVFTNWAVTDAVGNRPLKVAGPGSVRIEDTDTWCDYEGAWAPAAGFYSGGFAQRTSEAGDSVTIKYTCASTHNLYLGTALYTDRGQVSVSVDGGSPIMIDTYLNDASGAEIPARRLIQGGVAAGTHQVAVTVLSSNNAGSSGTNFVFDFIEAAVLSDVPDAVESLTGTSPAVDYDTQHGYQLSPARLLHIFDKLGCSGPMDEYVGVFWWNQRVNNTAVFPSVQVTFGGTFAGGDSIFMTLGTTTMGKSVFPADTPAVIAAHFAYFINELFSGVWASAAGAVLTITARSPIYSFTFSSSVASAAGTATAAGSLSGGAAGSWAIDPTQTPALNYAAQQWHADLYAQVKSRGWKITSAFSMELVNPPGAWAAQFADSTPAVTATGFGGLNSTQCAPGQTGFLAYQKAAFLQLAQLQAAAGLTPSLQCGEFLWWFFAGAAGMAYYDAATTAAAAAALGRPLQRFYTPNDNPSVNAYADANFLRNRLRDHVQAIRTYVRAAYGTAAFEVLYPYDVNYPSVYGPSRLGGRLNNYVNTPTEWTNSASGYLEAIKIEALDFGSSTRSIDLVASAVLLAGGWGWPPGKISYLYPVDNGGCPWQYEQQLAQGAGITALLPWALDHVCLFGWDLGEKLIPGSQVA